MKGFIDKRLRLIFVVCLGYGADNHIMILNVDGDLGMNVLLPSTPLIIVTRWKE